MFSAVMLASTGANGGVGLLDLSAGVTIDWVALPNATFLIEGQAPGTFYALHGDAESGYLTRLTLTDGRLHKNETLSTVGAEPCHAAWLAEGALVVACYTDSRLAVFQVDADGTISPPPAVIELHGDGPDRGRQERAHPHFVVAGVDRHGTLVVDLGSDTIWGLRRVEEQWHVTRVAKVRPGTGPRHAIVTGDTLMLSGELSAEVAVVSLSDGSAGPPIAVTAVDGESPAYPGDICLSAGRAALAVRGRSSVSLFDVSDPQHPKFMHETVIPGSWVQQLYPYGDRILAVDRDGGRLLDLDPATGEWRTLLADLDRPMWLAPVDAEQGRIA